MVIICGLRYKKAFTIALANLNHASTLIVFKKNKYSQTKNLGPRRALMLVLSGEIKGAEAAKVKIETLIK
jgi:hypothetical protein